MNYKDQKNGTLRLNEKISNTILIFLLLVRLADQYLPLWLFGPDTPNWFPHWYLGVAYILTVVIIWLNKHRLAALNVDRPFMVAMMLGGFLYIFYLMPAIGILVVIAAGLMFWAYHTNLLVFKNPVPYWKGTGLLILFSILLALVPVLIFRLQLKAPLDFYMFLTTLQRTTIVDLATIVFEEVLFRGALWAYIRNLGFSEKTALYTQAFLFWISHHSLLLLPNPYPFWIAVPIQSVLLGLMTWRSKSLTPSMTGHFLVNFVNQLILAVFR